MVMPPDQAGAYLIHFTGSKEHNVRLRGRARDRGWSLSEYGFVRMGADGEPLPLTDPGADQRTFATEAEAYAFLDLPFVEPETARGSRRVRGGSRCGRGWAAAADADHSRRSPGRSATPIRSGRTASTRSRRWPNPAGAAATSTRSSPTTRSRSRSRTASRRRRSRSSARSSPGSTSGSRREEAARASARGCLAARLPPSARLRARDPGRRPARLRGRAPRALRRCRRVAPCRPTAAARAADGARPDGDPLAARRHHRPPLGPDDPDP